MTVHWAKIEAFPKGSSWCQSRRSRSVWKRSHVGKAFEATHPLASMTERAYCHSSMDSSAQHEVKV